MPKENVLENELAQEVEATDGANMNNLFELKKEIEAQQAEIKNTLAEIQTSLTSSQPMVGEIRMFGHTKSPNPMPTGWIRYIFTTEPRQIHLINHSEKSYAGPNYNLLSGDKEPHAVFGITGGRQVYEYISFGDGTPAPKRTVYFNNGEYWEYVPETYQKIVKTGLMPKQAYDHFMEYMEVKTESLTQTEHQEIDYREKFQEWLDQQLKQKDE